MRGGRKPPKNKSIREEEERTTHHRKSGRACKFPLETVATYKKFFRQSGIAAVWVQTVDVSL